MEKLLINSKYRYNGTPQKFNYTMSMVHNKIKSIKPLFVRIPRVYWTIVSGYNDLLAFTESTDFTVNLTEGNYTADKLAAEIQTQMNAESGITVVVSYLDLTNRFQVENNSGSTLTFPALSSLQQTQTTAVSSYVLYGMLGLSLTESLAISDSATGIFPNQVDLNHLPYVKVNIDFASNTLYGWMDNLLRHSLTVHWNNIVQYEYTEYNRLGSYIQDIGADNVSINSIHVEVIPADFTFPISKLLMGVNWTMAFEITH